MTTFIVGEGGEEARNWQRPKFPPIQDHGTSPFVRELLIGRIRELGKSIAEQQGIIDENEVDMAACRERIRQAQVQVDELTAFLELVAAKDELPQVISGLPF
jgi:uncharacterized coiled-coil protein SlyX